MEELIKRLQEASEGNRDLSDECLLDVGWRKDDTLRDIYAPRWFRPDGTEVRHSERPDPTRNLQDALDWMVLEGWDWDMDWESEATGMYWDKGVVRVKMGNPDLRIEPECATPALALSAASLEAMGKIEPLDDIK